MGIKNERNFSSFQTYSTQGIGSYKNDRYMNGTNDDDILAKMSAGSQTFRVIDLSPKQISLALVRVVKVVTVFYLSWTSR